MHDNELNGYTKLLTYDMRVPRSVLGWGLWRAFCETPIGKVGNVVLNDCKGDYNQ